jgi:hypothetical protein
MPRANSSIDWKTLAEGRPVARDDDERLWAELRAIEIERWAIEDAVARAIAHGQARPVPPFRIRPSILRHPLLPAVCTAAMMFVLAYLQSRP